ncbi:MAG: HYR domain-containing protein, partial [Mariprofundales bacterium]
MAILLLTACGNSGNSSSNATATATNGTTIAGSVGDGPITGATVIVTDATGREVGRTTSDASAKYQLTVQSSAALPLTVSFQNGTDLVTGKKPSVPVTTMVVDSLTVGGTVTANGNPFSALIVDAAIKDAALRNTTVNSTVLNRARDRIVSGYNFGLDPAIDPIRTPISAGNAGGIIKSSEALAEAMRRSAVSLNKALTKSQTTNILNAPKKSQAIQTVLGVLAADVADGVVDGRAPANIKTTTTTTSSGAIVAGAATTSTGSTTTTTTTLSSETLQSAFLQMQANTISVLGEMISNTLKITNPNTGSTETDKNNKPITNATNKLNSALKTSTNGQFTGSIETVATAAATKQITTQIELAAGAIKPLLWAQGSSKTIQNQIAKLDTVTQQITQAASGSGTTVSDLYTTMRKIQTDPYAVDPLSAASSASETAAAVVIASNGNASASALATISPTTSPTAFKDATAQSTVTAATISKKSMPLVNDTPPPPTPTSTGGAPDTTPPTITAPPNQNIEATAILTPTVLGAAAVSDNSGVSLFALPDNPGPFPVGNTTITWSATDPSSNRGSATQTVTISDTTAPAVAAPANITVEATNASGTAASNGTIAAFLAAATATDAVDATPVMSNNAPTTFPIGTTTVTFTATDLYTNA